MLMMNRLGRPVLKLASAAINSMTTRKITTRQKQIIHKKIVIIKMAQVAKIDVAQAVKMGVKLPAVAALKQQKDVVPAKDLTYADPQAWKFNFETAEFVGGNPQVDGTYSVSKLDKGVMYEVYYYVAMKNHQVSSPVKLTLQLPNGTKQERTETITVDPNVWKAVSVGKFLNMFSSGDIKFTFSGVTGDTWKGLLLQCVLITPSF